MLLDNLDNKETIEITIPIHSCVALDFESTVYYTIDFELFYDKCKSNDFIEFLPGIYIKCYKINDSKCKHSVLTKLNKLFPNSNIIYQSITNLEANFPTQIDFKIFNFRNDIRLFMNQTLILRNKVNLEDQDMMDKAEIIGEEDKYENLYSDKIYKTVPTNKIFYPFNPGGNGSRCVMIGLFDYLNLINDSSTKYEFFSKHEMFLASSSFDYLLEECKNFNNCNFFYNTFIENNYNDNPAFHSSDYIKLREYNGIYIISNANHRVCCAKHFNIPELKAEVYIYNKKTLTETECNIDDFPLKPRGQSKDCNAQILNDYYKILHSLSLNNQQGDIILRNNLRGTNLIKYIEDCTNKTLIELAQNKAKQTNNL